MSSIAEKEIAEFGIPFTTVAQYDLTALSPDKRVQVREERHYAPKQFVDRFAIQMAHTAFPAIVITKDGFIVDGNTRIAAALQRGEKFFPALVLDVEYLGNRTTDRRKREIGLLAGTLNANSGNPLDKREMRTEIESAIIYGLTTGQIETRFGIKASNVNLIKREMDARAKLGKVGVNGDTKLTATALRALGSKKVLVLHDAPYRLVAQHASSAGLSASEIVALAADALTLGSEAEQVALLQQKMVEDGDRIRQRKITGSVHPMPSRTLRQHLGYVNKFVDNPTALLETDPANQGLAITAIESAIGVLTTLLAAQGS